MRWTWLPVLVLPTVLARLSDDWFQLLDLNHDGALDKSEYEQGLVKFQALFKQPLPDSAAVVSWSLLSMPSSSWPTMKGFWKAFTSSVMMIIATEIGDKTFFIAAVLSMKYDRWAVFGGAMVALIIMTILSTALGLLLPNVLPRQYTHIFGGILFLYFGIKLLLESRKLEAGKSSDELEEVEEELMRGSGKKQDEEEGGYAIQEKKKFWYQVGFRGCCLALWLPPKHWTLTPSSALCMARSCYKR